ncbi:alpha/beta fold hydrolase [Streptosporangium sp. NPDC023615]|uniref:alpha/beta fold hydrolase n=1 Tax=Streptosporangium sp. NPDC023615 TaxID=3154794 RepID=UPI0034244872
MSAVSAVSAGAVRDGRPRWRPCAGQDVPAGMECAGVEVPVDWSRPRGRTVLLEMARLPATEPARRIGSVLGVPGGPGARGIDNLKDVAGDLTELRRRFDLVAYDPRNTVWRDRMPAVCKEPAATLSVPGDRKAYDALVAAMAKGFDACRKADRTGLFAHMDSLSVARDMDAVRAALGEEKLSFMANSYGGVTSAAYARLFPRRVRAVYLDGVINQTRGFPDQTMMTLRLAEKAFGEFTRWCATTPACALHGQDAGALWRELIANADREPIPVTSAQFGKGELTGAHLRFYGFDPDPGPDHSGWLAFAGSVERARRGDGSGFAETAIGNARVWTMPGVLAMTCADGRGYTGYAHMRQVGRQVGRQARQQAPNLGEVFFDGLGCTGWPLPVVNPPRPLPVRGLPPMLGVGSVRGDYAWTESFTSMVPGSVTVAYDGPGHALYLMHKKCPVRHATAYLTDLTLPAPGTVCPAE